MLSLIQEIHVVIPSDIFQISATYASSKNSWSSLVSSDKLQSQNESLTDKETSIQHSTKG